MRARPPIGAAKSIGHALPSRQWLARFGAAAIASLAAACDSDPLTTLPSFDISDGAQAGGNPDFFFLPPLVPDPSQDPDFSPGEFDAGVRPTVHICMLEGSSCAALQPAGFPIVFTTMSGPGSETIRVSIDDEHYVVNWHAGDFTLDIAQLYRIAVLVAGTRLGFADVDVVSNGRDLRNATTGEYIGLAEGRTLPILFRIEQGGVVTIDVRELIAVQDQARLPPLVEIGLTENILVRETPEFLPTALVQVMETIAISDDAGVVPAVEIIVPERIAVSDTPHAVGSVDVMVSESIGVSDQPAVLPPASLVLGEMVTVADVARALPPIEIAVIEQIAVLDEPGVLPPAVTGITESIRIRDVAGVSQ